MDSDAALITAFVERWYLETNSFHLPVGEMAITLQDVGEILWIQITGEPVIYADDHVHDEELTAQLKECEDGAGYILAKLLSLFYDHTSPLTHAGRAAACLAYVVCSTLFNFNNETPTLM